MRATGKSAQIEKPRARAIGCFVFNKTGNKCNLKE